jgi:hypothetical protein
MRHMTGRNVVFAAHQQILQSMFVFTLSFFWTCSPQIALSQVNIATYQGNNSRTGLNSQEIILTPGNVDPTTFGQLFTYPVDGYVYAQPLYLSNITIPGKGPHNVIFVATENDSIYAFDADDPTGTNAPYLWKTSCLASSETAVPYQDVGTYDINPIIGITGTPVIDTVNGTLYVVAKSVDAQGNYHQRLHTIDVTTGLDKPGSPQEITATATGTGDGSVNGVITFNPLRQNQRPALLFSNGTVYITWASHGDKVGNPLNGTYPEGYHGWMIAYQYNETSHVFTQVAAFNTTPNGTTQIVNQLLIPAAGGIWMSGSGPAADSAGNIFFITGNGFFDGIADFGDSFVKLSPDLSSFNYFSPYYQQALSEDDEDLGSGGVMLLPAGVSANGHANLLVGAGKQGTLYVIDRDTMGLNGPLSYYSPFSDYVVQELINGIGPSFGSPAWFNNTLYYGGVSDTLKAFSFLATRSQDVAYSGGFAGVTGLSLNGPAGTTTQQPTITGTRLTLTDGGNYEARSAFTTYKVNVAEFNCAFQFQLTNASEAGFTFTLQNASPTAIGADAGNLGYGGTSAVTGVGNSFAMKFQFFPSSPGETYSSTGIYFGGNAPLAPFTNLDTPYGIHFTNGDIFDVVMHYDGTTLTVTIADSGTANPSITPPTLGPSATLQYTVDIPSQVGNRLAYAGFTAGTGGQSAIQQILNWVYKSPTATSTVLTQVAQGTTVYGYPGTTPTLSANGTADGIVWLREITSTQTARLHAFDASDLTELYNSDMSGTRDAIGPGVKFSVPVIANGKAFLGTQTQLVAFGLLNQNFPVLTASYSNLRRVGSNYLVNITVTNIGNRQAATTQLTGCALGQAAKPRAPLPLNLGTLLPGQSITGSLAFPLSAGASGSVVSLTISDAGIATGGTTYNYNNSFTVTLP